MAKTGFYQTNPTVEETVSSLVETATDLSNTDDKAKSSFFNSNSTVYEELGSISSKVLYARFVIFIQGLTNNGELVGRFLVPDAINFDHDLAGSLASASTAATANTVYTVKKNGNSVATITFAASGTDGTFGDVAGILSLATGDVLSVHAPATADATLSDVSITLAGIRAT